MIKNHLNRERLEKIKSWRETYGAGSNVILSAEEAEELARIALAAMDSEPVELPLDYLHGHKDGLEWAAQLAEANHPETGDWLYDDPIELAKAIRKGPDMPPVQPVADSEPDRNPVLAYADSYRDMAKQGVESVPIWSVITDLERNIAPLYRHAQPVKNNEFIPQNLDKALGVVGVALPESKEDFNFQIERWIQRLIDRVIRYADEFQALPSQVVPEGLRMALSNAGIAAPESDEMLAATHEKYVQALVSWVRDRKPFQPAPVVPVVPVVPATLPCSVELKPGLIIGKGCKTETLLTALRRRADYNADIDAMTPEERAEHDASIKAFKAMLAAATQSPGSEQSTVPGKWIPVSEQKPDCWCLTCRPMVLNDTRFVVCPDCGNKRCPRANDHRNVCTWSNEPGQEGSAYQNTPQEEKP